MPRKAITVYLFVELAVELAAVARADGVTVSELVREAVETHIAARRRDMEFRKRLKKRFEEDREVLRRLAGGRGGQPPGEGSAADEWQ